MNAVTDKEDPGDAWDEPDTGKPPCIFCRREIPCECDADTCMCSCGRCMAEAVAPRERDRTPLLFPECRLGYTERQLREILTDRLPEFHQWMRGQTQALCEGRLSWCGPHGVVTYPWDLERFLAGLPVVD